MDRDALHDAEIAKRPAWLSFPEIPAQFFQFSATSDACFLAACGRVATPELRGAHVARWPSGPALEGEAERRLVGVAE